VKVGLFAPLGNPFATPSYMTTLGQAAEERGFHSLWVAEHVVLFDDYASKYPYAEDGRIPAGGESGIFEPMTALAYLAAGTSTIRLGTGICLVPQRNPVYTAKEVASVDWLSDGRVDFGIGVGWLKEEFDAVAAPFEKRGERCRSYLKVMQALWQDDISEYHDEFYDLPACRQYPKPVQRPHPPLWFGGTTDRALARVADLGTGWYVFDLVPSEVAERVGHLGELLEARGRSVADVKIAHGVYSRLPVTGHDVAAYRDAGVDQFVVSLVGPTVDDMRRQLDEFAADLVGRY